ncbi:MAG: putative CoB--CoM heterodisulfide reductase 2 iron-sulfur subunit D [Promethearchaeota archaeon]|nr:MAG: putative CoB--CoM heterodisulfide reductase 2 iron-sulfur subunit D [Candidatus Lokiarchaeota archaeon]
MQKNCGDCGYAIRPAVGRFLTCPIKEAKGEEAFEIYFSRGRMAVLKSILEGKLPLSKELAEFVYQCSECGNCTEVCHQTQNENIILNTSKWINHVEVWDALRKDLVEAGYAPLDKHARLIDLMNTEKMKNPYGEPQTKKYEWAQGFSNVKEKGELAIFAGCTMPLRQTETLKNMMKIFQATGKEIAYSNDEWCCGSIAMRIGDYESVKEEMTHNLELFKHMGAKVVFSPCAGCYRTLKKDYPELLDEDLPFEVKHITEILSEMMNKGEIPFKNPEEESVRVTYHDPCHLGRHMDLYEIPREVIKKIPGIELLEMKRNRQNAWCCGAGGGVKSQFPELALSISVERIKEAIERGAEILLTSCPFCVNNLLDAYNSMNSEVQERIKVIDIIDFIASKI